MKHNKPHVHAEYGKYTALSIANGELLGGKLPKKLAMVQVWIAIHEEELMVNWKIKRHESED